MLQVDTKILQHIKISSCMLLILTLITGLLYPLLITIFAQGFFPDHANGSILLNDKTMVGSKLIGQQFSSAKYFWGRPSATVSHPYNSLHSQGSNLGPHNPKLLDLVHERVVTLKKHNPQATIKIPVELVTASASGLDPEISIRAAMYQVPRIASARKINNQRIHKLIMSHSKNLYWNIFSEPSVNVLQLNLALDQASKEKL